MRLYLLPSQSARPTPNSKPRSITGRDSYIIAEALYRYIATEQAKPDREQSWSNLQDAIAIFNAPSAQRMLASSPTNILIDEKAPRNHSE